MHVRLRLIANGFLAGAVLGLPAHASILGDVLFRIDQMGRSPLAAVMVNLAENIATPTLQERVLEPGQSAIIGYDAMGRAVEVMAGPAGVVVTSAMAQTLQTGLQAGLYPIGSQLYELPPAGQLSLFEQSRDGAQLAQAQALLMTRVDGRITNVITGVAFPDLAPAALTRVYQSNTDRDLLELAILDATTLGAVNSGQIVTNVAAEWQSGLASQQLSIELARISTGANILVENALTTDVQVVSLVAQQLGGVGDSGALVLNQATNATEVVGRILNIVQDQQVSIGQLTTTTIGAINAGSVNPDTP